ncbi:MAG: FecR domain-containing protein [Bacteroidota bacterium]
MQNKDISALVNQESFLNYCFKRNDKDIRHWEKWLMENPEQQKQVEDLCQVLILMADESQKRTTHTNFAELQHRIRRSALRENRTYQPLWKKWSIAAAAVLVITCAGALFYRNADKTTQMAETHDIAPGGHKATLILANGNRVNLTDAVNGAIASQHGVQIRKTANGQIVYDVSGMDVNTAGYNVIETPLGGEYQVNLPDGTHVWLNSGSSLRYPLRFAGKERRVELSGEGYFEVVHNSAMPFKVVSAGQTVEVLGTHFNVSAYADEKMIKTSLLQGAVKVSEQNESRVLVPGQQAQLSGDKLTVVNDVDLEDVTSWKNGYFKFNENLESIMNKISRWYGIEVVYQMKPDPQLSYSGKISRTRNISAVLKIIAFNDDVHFKIVGKKVYVSR